MKDIINKLSSYNLFNYLLPGSVFAILLAKETGFVADPLKFDLANLVLMYFAGLAISRIGSLLIEGILNRTGNIKPIDTAKLVTEIEKSTKSEIIFEAMNMYRTLTSMCLILTILTIADIFFHETVVSRRIMVSLLEALGFILFLFAFIKQRKKVLKLLEPYNRDIGLKLFGIKF